MTTEHAVPPLRPLKALVNGLLAWILGFVVYMLPGIMIGMQMGYELGSQGIDRDDISRQISAAVGEFYRVNLSMRLAGVLCIALLIFWRAHVVSRGAGTMAVKRGLLVALVPAVIGSIWAMQYQFGIVEIVAIVAYIIAGVTGARRGASVPAPTGTRNP